MKSTEERSFKYKTYVKNQVLNKLNNQFFDPSNKLNIRYFTKSDPHVFQRVIDRNISFKTFEGIFKELFEKHYDKLLALFDRDKSKMNSENSVDIYVTKDDISICFIVFNDDTEGFYSLMPLTVLDNYTYKKCAYEIKL